MKIKLQAHRGVSTEYPENTLPAFRAAIEQGYDYIEVDPHFTADSQCVLIHDYRLNRTCRTADGLQLPEPVSIEDITYAQARQYDAGVAFDARFRGTRIPLLSELLELTRHTAVTVKIDNRFQCFSPEQLDALLRIVKESGAQVAFTCSQPGFVRMIHERLPECEIHYDGYVDEAAVQKIAAIVGSKDFYVWLGLDTPKIAWVTVPKASPELCAMVKRYAHLGIWILSTEEEREAAAQLGAELIETTGSLKPDQNRHE
ncbi:MAG: glycerophosphodiester phosphodiesterase [Candidatus Ventricola sp.]